MATSFDSLLELKIRTTRDCRVGGRVFKGGEILIVPVGDALPPIARGDVGVIFDLPNVAPCLPPEGCSLADAYYAHVNALIDVAHPSLRGQPLPKVTRIRVAKYTEEPPWHWVPELETRPPSSYAAFVDPDGAAARWRARQMARPSLETQFKRAYAANFVDIATYRFLARLKTEELTSHGVWEGDLAQQEPMSIPTAWWIRELLLDLARSEIRELIAGHRKMGARRFSGVIIFENGEVTRKRPKAYIRVYDAYIELPKKIRDKEARRGGKTEIAKMIHKQMTDLELGTVERELRNVLRDLRASGKE